MVNKVAQQVPNIHKVVPDHNPVQMKLLTPPATDRLLMKELVNQKAEQHLPPKQASALRANRTKTTKQPNQAAEQTTTKQTSAEKTEKKTSQAEVKREIVMPTVGKPAERKAKVALPEVKKAALPPKPELPHLKSPVEVKETKLPLKGDRLVLGKEVENITSAKPAIGKETVHRVDLQESKKMQAEELPVALKYVEPKQVATVNQMVTTNSSAPIEVSHLPPSFNQQVQAVAEYIQVAAPNLKQLQTVHIKLSQKIMPDAQFLITRNSNLQLAVTMVSRRDETLTWFNNMAPNLASYLGTKLKETVDITVKNPALAQQDLSQQDKSKQTKK